MASRKDNGSGSPPIEAVVVDFGEVLCFRPEPAAMGKMAKLFRIAPERFLECYIPTRGPYDQGLVTPEEYWMDFARRAGMTIDAALVEELRTMDTAMWSRIDMEMTDWVEKLHKAGITTALLSNMQHDMAAHARKNFDWLRNFDHQILSCELRLIKPDAAIFRHTIERIGVRPQETLFVDDREANVEAARVVGLRAIRFESTEQLRSDLKEMGFAFVPPKRKTRPRAAESTPFGAQGEQRSRRKKEAGLAGEGANLHET
jgi:putative hydrolase of the HAD superfamily